VNKRQPIKVSTFTMARMLPAQRVTEWIKHGWPAGVHRQLQVINDGAHPPKFCGIGKPNS
jgi:hypothetical protein